MLTFLGSCLLLRKSITLVLSKSFYRCFRKSQIGSDYFDTKIYGVYLGRKYQKLLRIKLFVYI